MQITFMTFKASKKPNMYMFYIFTTFMEILIVIHELGPELSTISAKQ